jgi:ankyrin repeat protein
MTQPRPSLLITSVGAINVLIGLAFVGFGLYVIIAGADAVTTLFQLQTETGKAADFIAGKDNAQQAKDAAGLFTKGLSGFILAFALVIAGCSIVQGLPNLLVGVGVLMRWNVARVFAIVFAVLAVLAGVACLAAVGQSNRFLYVGLFLLFYAILTFVSLLGRRASLEFSGGLKQAADSLEPEKSGPMSTRDTNSAPRRPIDVVLLVIALTITATTAVFATLYFARGTPPAALVEIVEPKPKPAKNGEPTPIDDMKAMIKHQPKLAEFHEAALAGQIPRAAEMLKNVDVDEPDEHGRTALMKVSATGNVRMAMFLVAMGAQINQRDKEGLTAVMYAIEKDQIAIISIFVNNGGADRKSVEALRAQYSEAAKSGPVSSLDVDMRDNRGQTAFMQAIVKGRLEAADRIRFWSKTDDLEDAEGNSILHLLAADGNMTLVRQFEWRADGKAPCWCFGSPPKLSIGFSCFGVNQVNRAGRTPWMLAAEKGHLAIVKHLLSGPRSVKWPGGGGKRSPPVDDLHLKDKSGKTGLDLATANGHKDVVAYLTSLEKSKGGNP